VLKNIPRTTNFAESWNKVLNSRTIIAHPNITQFIVTLKSIECINKFDLSRGGCGVYKFNTRNLRFEKSLFVCVVNFKFYGILDFLSALLRIYSSEFDETLD
jgi:hypothetical protein